MDALNQTREEMRRPFAAVVLFSIAINLLALTVPLYMTQVFDRVLTSYSVETLVMLTLLALGLIGLFVALDNLRGKVLTRAALRAEQRLGAPLLAAATQDQLAGRTDPNLPLRDLVALRGFASSPVVTAFCDAPMVPLYVIVTFLIHPALGCIALLGALFMFACAFANQLATARRAEAAGKATHALLHGADQQTRNADVIHAMGLTQALRQRWRDAQDVALGEQLQSHEEGGRYQVAMRYTRLALQVATLAFGAALVIAGDITAGMMFAASIILTRGLQPVEVAVSSWRALLSARSSYERIRDALARAGGMRAAMALPPPRGRITVENVIHALGAERRPVLKGISFELAAGESLGIIGPAASGKSTLVRLLLGVWPPTSGKVRLDGADVSLWPRDDLGRHIGYLPQEVELFPGTVAENIARMESPDAEAVVAAARWARVHDMILRLPQGYDTRIMAGGLMLSPGQRQRIALARALYRAPQLLVLDEPNSNLDGEGEDALAAALEEAATRGITAVVVAHRMAVVRQVKKLLLLNDGALQAFGHRDEILARPRLGVIRSGAA